ncbi:MAG: hypothetical protein U9Q16_01555 [Patescibacteria group bacterium]|nr:hypothetical protein [Patescibacteria group bacterium]
MNISLKPFGLSNLFKSIKLFWQKKENIFNIFAVITILVSVLVFGVVKAQKAKTESFSAVSPVLELAVTQGNSLLPDLSHSLPEPEVTVRMKMIMTAYSSTVWQTDDSPFITASGSTVRHGIVANNMLNFGTRIRIPELYGDEIFVVEDRMHWKKSNYHLDIWFPEYIQAKNFGAQKAYIEVLES